LLKGKCRYCNNLISPLYFLLELIGGFAFLKFDFLNPANIYLAIFLFYLLILVCFDYQNQAFPTIFLIPLFSVTFIHWIQTSHTYTLIDVLEFWPIFLILILYTLIHKLGSGDLIIYILIAIFWNPHFANLILLLAAFLSLIHYTLEYKQRLLSQTFAFIPYIYLGLIIGLLSF
ncbi:MAG: prepilin peptidase, partial [Lactobacillus sp.]|nr:prepilin peptidase [Lactobacillus sp.]